MVIAIDGPSASGKSTAAKILATALGYRYIDTGAMYRALTFKALSEGISISDISALNRLSAGMRIEFKNDSGKDIRVLLDGADVTEDVRSQRVNDNVSNVSRLACVRKNMVRKQRDLCKHGDVIIEGRDIGTVVAPSAGKKFYLDANIVERARRRPNEPLKSMKKRDRIDATRKESPLTIAKDALYIDTSDMTVDEVCSCMLYELAKAGKV